MPGASSKIWANGLHKVFPGTGRDEQVVAIEDFCLDIQDGEFTALLGPSGCGKSTFLRMIAGLDFPSSGELLVDGSPVSGPSAQRGMLFQAYALFPWMSIRDNVEFGPRSRGIKKSEYRDSSQRLIELVGLQGFEDRYPHQLSGGMQQRGALARLFANDPDVLLMDEPLAAVDAQTRELLQEELSDLWSGYSKTVVLVTHSVEEAVFLSQRVAVMSRRPGRVKTIVDVDMPFPRDLSTRESIDFHDTCAEVNRLVREEIVDSTRNA